MFLLAGASHRTLRRLAVAACLLAATLYAARATAQSYSVLSLHQFAGSDGTYPSGPLVSDANGDLFGTTALGGSGQGVVYELVRNSDGSYAYTTLYAFSGADGSEPSGGVTLDSHGNLFGATVDGGADGFGVVFELTNNGDGTYSEQTLYTFTGGSDGQWPDSSLSLDANGNFFGTAWSGGAGGAGVVFELAKGFIGGYIERTLYSFAGDNNGANPVGGVTRDPAGDLFGVTQNGGAQGVGSVFELVNDNGTYVKVELHSFGGGTDGADPEAGVVLDSQGNLFGTTQHGGSAGAGFVYEIPRIVVGYPGLYPEERTLYSFTGYSDAGSPVSSVALDADGNIFGNTPSTLYELVNHGGSYSEETLGALPFTTAEYYYGSGAPGVLLDSSGDIFGIGNETVWELPMSLTLTSSANPIFDGDSTTLTASLSSTPSSPPVSGTVTFSEGSTVLGTATMQNDQASLTVEGSTLGDGSDTISAQFTPTGQSFAGSSASVVETVNPASDVAALSGNNTFTGSNMFYGNNTFDGNNTFFGAQTVNGDLSARTLYALFFQGGVFQGDGRQLTGVTAAGLAPNASIAESQVTNLASDLTYNLSTSEAFATTAAQNAEGAANVYTTQTVSNALNSVKATFVPLAGGTMTGALNLPSLAATGNLSGASGNFSGVVSTSGLSVGPAGTATASSNYNSGPLSATASVFNSSTNAAEPFGFQWQAEPANNGSTSPGATLNLLYAANGAPAETGLSVNADGTIHFTANQVFPGSLTNGSSPNFGTVNATAFQGGSFSGNGSQLTGVTAAGLAPAASISESQVMNLTGDLANNLSTSEAYAITAANNAETGAVTTAENFASASFVPLAGGTMTGALTLPSLAATGGVTAAGITASGPLAGGSLSIGGGTPITEYLSVTLPVTLPALKAGTCTTFQTPPLTAFTPGDNDTISLGIPSTLQTGLSSGAGGHGPRAHAGSPVFLVYQAWETPDSSPATVTLQVCNPSAAYSGGATGTIRFDILRH